jgi:hypothetical protein
MITFFIVAANRQTQLMESLFKDGVSTPEVIHDNLSWEDGKEW